MTRMLPVLTTLLALAAAGADRPAITAGRVKLEINPERGGVPSGLWYDLNRDGVFEAGEKMLDTGAGQGLVLEVVERPRAQTGPADSWYPGEPYRLRALSDSVEVQGPRIVVSGRFLWAGAWPYRLEWEIGDDGAVRGLFQLLGERRERKPSEVVALGLDLRFHYRSAASFRRRTVRAAVDKRVWDLPAEVVRWWSGRRAYDANSQSYGYRGESEIPWPDFNLVTLVQSGAGDCRLWKATAVDAGNLTHWRGAKSRGWMHLEDREWGLAYGIPDMPSRAPGSLSADMDTGDETASVSLRFWPPQAHRLDLRGPGAEKIAQHRFFLLPNEGRWNDGMAQALDRLGIPSTTIADGEPDPEKVKFSKPADLPPPRKSELAVFRIDEPGGVERRQWPVTAGIPLRQGEVRSPNELQLTEASGRPVPYQAETLAYWPDHSVKWVLLDAQVDLPKSRGAVFSLQKAAPRASPAGRVAASQTATGVRVDTGPLAFEIDRSGSGFIDRAWLDLNHNGRFEDGEMVAGSGGGRRSILDYVRTERYRTGDHDVPGAPDNSRVRVTELRIERGGPLRAAVLVRGVYTNRVESPFTLRLEAFAGKPWIRAQHTFIYTMDPQSEFLRAAGLSLPLRMTGNRRVTFPGTALPESFARGELLQETLNEAVVWGAEGPGAPARRLATEPRSSGWADLSTESWGLTVAVQNFWQEFAKGIAVDKAENSITAWFWPPEAPPLDLRRYSRWMHPQVGESVETTAIPEWRAFGYADATGLAKTSTAVFAFHARPFEPEEAATLASGFNHRPVAVCNPQYYSDTRVAGPFAVYDEEKYPRLERTLTDIADWFLFNRERFSWYGLVDYGDIGHMSRPAFQYEEGKPYQFRDGWAYDIGRWGWTNTEGQDALGYMMSFFHTGYRPYFDASAVAARHNQDVDVFHWGPQKYHGHTRHNVNHWGDGDTEIRISQPSPNRFYYYLTGDARSRDVIEGVVDELYMKHIVRHTADLGAVLYGFLVRWEMTGDAAWRDRALAVARSYGDYMAPNGSLPHMGIMIEAATGRRLNEARPVDSNPALFFLHGFGAIHAMIEFDQLTGDKRLGEILYRHALHCAGLPPGSDSYWLILSYELARTGETVFSDRILSSLAQGRLVDGIYPRDRKYWTGVWGEGKTETRGRLTGTVPGVRDIYTSGTGFSWNPLPALLRALQVRGIEESRVPERPARP